MRTPHFKFTQKHTSPLQPPSPIHQHSPSLSPTPLPLLFCYFFLVENQAREEKKNTCERNEAQCLCNCKTKL